MTKEKKTDVSLDLANLDTSAASEKGARIEIVHPLSKEPLGIFITVLGKHSSTFRELVRDRINKRVKEESMASRRGKHLAPRTAEEIERDALEMLVACTITWDSGEGKNYITFEGQQLEFNAGNALTVYSKLIWLREQVDEAIGDLENFIKA